MAVLAQIVLARVDLSEAASPCAIVRPIVGTVRVRDRAPGARDFELEIDLEATQLTVGQLIGGRVTAELMRAADEPGYRPLVEQSADEMRLNGPRPSPSPPELKDAIGGAVRAFEAGRYIVVVDGRQATSAEDVVTLTPSTEVTFLRLTPLRGG